MEVEQLTGKEIARALAQMVPAEEVAKQLLKEAVQQPQAPQPAQPEVAPQPAEVQVQPAPPVAEQAQQAEQQAVAPAQQAPAAEVQQPQAPLQQAEQQAVTTMAVPRKVIDGIKDLKGTLEAVAYDRSWNEVSRVKVKDLFNWMQQVEPGKIYAVVFDGIVTQRLLDVASEKGIALLIGARIGSKVTSKKGDVIFMTFSDLT
jgi:DNA primase